MWICPFQEKKDFQSVATSVAGGANTIITQSAAGWTVNQFQTSAVPASDSSHFVHILDGPNAGTVADIISNDASSVVVSGNYGSSPFKYAIRKHTTLGSIFLDAGLAEFEDEVLVFDDFGVSRNYQYDGTVGARHIVDAATQSVISDNVVVYPGQGFVLTIGSAKKLTFGGGSSSYVLDTTIAVPLVPGIPNLVGLMDPVVASAPLTSTLPIEQHTIGSIGLQAAGLSEFEDEIARFGVLAGSFTRLDINYYDSTAPGLIVDSTTGADSGSRVIPNGTAFLVKPIGGVTRRYLQPAFHP